MCDASSRGRQDETRHVRCASSRGRQVLGYVRKVQDIEATDVDREAFTLDEVEASLVRCPDPTASDAMIDRIDEIRKKVGRSVCTSVGRSVGRWHIGRWVGQSVGRWVDRSVCAAAASARGATMRARSSRGRRWGSGSVSLVRLAPRCSVSQAGRAGRRPPSEIDRNRASGGAGRGCRESPAAAPHNRNSRWAQMANAEEARTQEAPARDR